MKNRSLDELLGNLIRLAPALRQRGIVLAGEAAAHAHLAAATSSLPGRPVGYTALPPRRLEVLGATPEAMQQAVEDLGVATGEGPLLDILRGSLPLFRTEVALADGTRLPVLSREAVLAELLGRGGLALGLAGVLLHFRGEEPMDVDEVRELLKAAGQPERFQPLLELLQVA